jgi:hypothetical protein
VNSHVTGNSRGGYNAQHKIEEIHRKKITKTSDSNGFPAYTTRLRDLLVNTKNWYRRECDLWAQLGKKNLVQRRRISSKDSAEMLVVSSFASVRQRNYLC